MHERDQFPIIHSPLYLFPLFSIFSAVMNRCVSGNFRLSYKPSEPFRQIATIFRIFVEELLDRALCFTIHVSLDRVPFRGILFPVRFIFNKGTRHTHSLALVKGNSLNDALDWLQSLLLHRQVQVSYLIMSHFRVKLFWINAGKKTLNAALRVGDNFSVLWDSRIACG